MHERTRTGTIILLLVLCQGMPPLFSSAETLQTRSLDAASALHSTFGAALGGRAVQAGLGIAGGAVALFPGSSASAAARSGHLRVDTIRASNASDVVLHQTQAYFRRLRAQLQVFVLRLLASALWTSALFPLLLACIVDGIVQRKVELACERIQSPHAYSLGKRALLLSGLLPWIYAGLPCSVPAVLVPMGVLMAAPSLWLTLRHMPPLFTR